MPFTKRYSHFLGWLIFYLLTQLLAPFSARYIASMFAQYDNGPFKILVGSITLVTYVIFNFVFFHISIRAFVLPLYTPGKLKPSGSRQITFALLTRKWFDYFSEFFIFSFLGTCVKFSTLEVNLAITMAWQLVACYIAFRLALHPWIEKVTDSTQPDSEMQNVMA
jgi:hypothetical protein